MVVPVITIIIKIRIHNTKINYSKKTTVCCFTVNGKFLISPRIYEIMKSLSFDELSQNKRDCDVLIQNYLYKTAFVAQW